MLRKVIAIPADDRIREWRDWQADKDEIAKILAEERRLGLQAKIKHCETLRGIGGGALILITPVIMPRRSISRRPVKAGSSVNPNH